MGFSAGTLEAEARTLFSSGYCSSTVADHAARVRILEHEQDGIRQYREDDALAYYRQILDIEPTHGPALLANFMRR